jgi:hypothetical protein
MTREILDTSTYPDSEEAVRGDFTPAVPSKYLGGSMSPPVVTLYGPDGEVSFCGVSEIRQAFHALAKVMAEIERVPVLSSEAA